MRLWLHVFYNSKSQALCYLKENVWWVPPFTSFLKWIHRLVWYFMLYIPFSRMFVVLLKIIFAFSDFSLFHMLLIIYLIFFKKPVNIFSFSFLKKCIIPLYSIFISYWKSQHFRHPYFIGKPGIYMFLFLVSHIKWVSFIKLLFCWMFMSHIY